FGVATIIGLEALETLDLRQLGQLAILGATLSYAFASVWGRVQLAGVPPVLNAAGMLTASSLLVVPLALWVDGAPEAALSGAVLGSILGLGILATAVAYLLYFEIMRLSGAANTMLVTLLIPPFALMLGWAFLDETVSTRSLVGFALIALGLAVIDGRPFRRSAATV
ncbi:MAG: DMT family transporter, partial [Pseudomonadota bacterium]